MKKKDDRSFEDKVTDILPCKPGDTIFIIDTVDCKSGECPDVDSAMCEHSRMRAPTEAALDCKDSHPIIREVQVDGIAVLLFQLPDKEEYGALVVINEIYTFTPDMLGYIKKTYDGAAALLEEE